MGFLLASIHSPKDGVNREENGGKDVLLETPLVNFPSGALLQRA